jgi:hypothetical protein
MNLRFCLSLVVSLLAMTGCLYVSWVPQTTLPFDVRPGTSSTQFLIQPSSLGLPMPAGLQVGDELDLASMELRTRVLFTSAGGNPLAGENLNLPVIRDGKPLVVSVTMQLDHKTGENLMIYLASLALTWLFAALGLLLLWRGQRQAAWAVCVWCLLNVLLNVGTSVYIELPYTSFIATICNYLLNIGTLIVLYLLADDLTRSGTSERARRNLRGAFMLLFAIYAVYNPYLAYWSIFHGVLIPYFKMLIVVHLAAFAIPLTLLGLFYRHAPAAERARIRWVWASILLYVVSYLASTNVFGFTNGLEAALVVTTFTAAAFLGSN